MVTKRAKLEEPASCWLFDINRSFGQKSVTGGELVVTHRWKTGNGPGPGREQKGKINFFVGSFCRRRCPTESGQMEVGSLQNGGQCTAVRPDFCPCNQLLSHFSAFNDCDLYHVHQSTFKVISGRLFFLLI